MRLRYLITILFICCILGCLTKETDNLLAWSGQKPVVLDGKITNYVPAPEFLFWRKADLKQDGFSGSVLRVKLVGPFIKGAWSQAAGAVWQMPKTFSVGQSFTVRFKARSLKGSPHLTVLRTYGGAKPWETIKIDTEWRDYEVTLIPQFETNRITFSLAPKKGRLQPYCAGEFEVAKVSVTGNNAK